MVLTDRIEWLFQKRLWDEESERLGTEGRPLSYREVAERAKAAGKPVSHGYIERLHNGRDTNPGLRVLEGIAAAFEVPVWYLVLEPEEWASGMGPSIEDDPITRDIVLQLRALSPDARLTVLKTVQQMAPAAVAEKPRGHEPIALVVEDDPDAMSIAEFAVERAGYQPKRAYTAAEANAQLRATPRPPQLVILDLHLPGPDSGVDLLRQIREDEVLGQVPIIITTAHREMLVGVSVEDDPSLYIMEKPLLLPELVRRAQQVRQVD